MATQYERRKGLYWFRRFSGAGGTTTPPPGDCILVAQNGMDNLVSQSGDQLIPQQCGCNAITQDGNNAVTQAGDQVIPQQCEPVTCDVLTQDGDHVIAQDGAQVVAQQCGTTEDSLFVTEIGDFLITEDGDNLVTEG